MAKKQIVNLNYIVTGNIQKILNVDILSDDGETVENMSFFTDSEANSLSCEFGYDKDAMNPDGSLQRIQNINQYGYALVSSHNEQSGSNYIVRALYDAKDVAFKSAVAARISLKRQEDNSSTDNNIDIYFPHLKKNPLGFVQMRQYSYGMTEKTIIAPVMLGTNLKDQRNNAIRETASYTMKPSWRYNLNPYDRFRSNMYDPGTIENLIPTYLYTPLDRLQQIVYEVLDAKYSEDLLNPEISANVLSVYNAEISTYSNVSYYSFREFAEKYIGYDVLSNYFKPVYNFENIDHNYIFEVPVKADEKKYNRYNAAQIKADIVMAKNGYDDIYDTNVEQLGKFDRIRQYVGIHSCGGRLFLKYFDDRHYSADDSFRNDNDYRNNEVKDIATSCVNENDYSNRDYMKIECVDSINRFITTSLHKANLFSAKVYGLDDVLPNSKYTEDQKSRIKIDIDNSIRRIVKNFTPAHTQYFGVVAWPKDKPEQYC